MSFSILPLQQPWFALLEYGTEMKKKTLKFTQVQLKLSVEEILLLIV